MNVIGETDRLIIREITITDIDGLFELDSDPDVHKFLGNKPISSKSAVVAVVNHIQQQYIENGIGRWAIEEKATGKFMGWTGLKLVTERINNHINYYDLGYRLIRKFWGKGIASESAQFSLQYGFEKLNLKEINAAAHVDNHASNKILSKLGFKQGNQFSYDGSQHLWYNLEKSEWKRNHA